MKKFVSIFPLAATAALLVSCASLEEDTKKDSAPLRASVAKTPEEAIAAMELPPGYRLEVVLAEPQIEEPALAVFDGNGVMYVAEMRIYKQDADATGEFEPTSRVSRHEDTNGDGAYDRHTVFVDNMLLPRIVLPLDDRVIIGETNTLDLYVYRDSDGDGVADEKELWFDGGPRGGNLEHQPSGLIWAQDNWLYTTYNDYRLRYANGQAVQEEIPQNGGQWGLTQDDNGKVWYLDAGGEQGPIHFQQHILDGAYSVDGEEADDFRVVWPIDDIPDTQGGRFQLRDDNSLNHFTATCGQDIFRGDRLPADLRGDLLFAEPLGRLIRRARIEVQDGVTRLENVYPQKKFIRTKDPLFRPVNMSTAPDGTLYLVDMYRGIIQEGNWTKKGSYLREIIDETGLGYEIGKGRIYRLVHEHFEPGPQAPNARRISPPMDRTFIAPQWLVARHRSKAARIAGRRLRRPPTRSAFPKRCGSSNAGARPVNARGLGNALSQTDSPRLGRRPLFHSPARSSSRRALSRNQRDDSGSGIPSSRRRNAVRSHPSHALPQARRGAECPGADPQDRGIKSLERRLRHQ